MGIFRYIPLIDRIDSYLSEVDFPKLREELEALQSIQGLQEGTTNAGKEITGKISKASGLTNPILSLITKFPNIVGMSEWADKLRQVLGPVAGKNSALIVGAPGSGKTTLNEYLIRERAMGRLSGKLGTKPFFIFDAVLFCAGTNPGRPRINAFNTVLKTVADSHGMLICDHIDDFRHGAGDDAPILLMLLVANLERNRRNGMQAITSCEDSNLAALYESADSMKRAFSELKINKEPTADVLRQILFSTAVKLERNHNLDYSPEAIEETIRVLARYPGRAFVGKSPDNAIELLDTAGAYVRRHMYAEPPELTNKREKLSRLRDEYTIVSQSQNGNPEALQTQIDSLQTEVAERHAVWAQKFGPLFRAQRNLETIERELPKLRAIKPRTADENKRMEELAQKTERSSAEDEELKTLKEKRPRRPEEETNFSTYTDTYEAAKKAVLDAEAALENSVAVVLPEDVRAVFNAAAGISVKSPTETRARTRRTKEYLKTQVFGQDEAVEILADGYNARENGTKDPSKPTVYLFPGGSGLGKTELATALQRWDLGLEDRPDLADQVEPIVINMSEYGDSSKVSGITGSARGLVGYGEDIPFHVAVRNNPRGILVLDEFDKGHPAVGLSFMQVFDKGKLEDSAGKPVNFKDLIIIVCMNGLTADDLDPSRRHDPAYIKDKLKEVQSTCPDGGQLLTDYMLGRFNGGIVIFNNLGEATLVKIFDKFLRKLNDDFRDKGVLLTADPAITQEIVAAYPDRSIGARAEQNIMQRYIRPALGSFIEERDELLDAQGGINPARRDRVHICFHDKKVTIESDVINQEPQPPGINLAAQQVPEAKL